MSAQEKWKQAYRDYKYGISIRGTRKSLIAAQVPKLKRVDMFTIRREAALERKLAAAQRRIEYLESDLKLAQEQAAECEERREFAARMEFGA